MKKYIYTLFFIIFSFGSLSCVREASLDEAPLQEGEGRISFSFQLDGEPIAQTKAVGQIARERKINSLTVAVYDEDTENLERVFTVNPNADLSTVVSDGVKAGEKIINVFANFVPDFSVYDCWDDTPLTTFADNSWENSNFTMRSIYNSVTVTANSTTNLSVNLVRDLSRVTIKQIKNFLPNGLPIYIQGAYLANVYDRNWSSASDTDASHWMNKWGRFPDLSVPDPDADYNETLENMDFPDLTTWSPGDPSENDGMVYISNGQTYTCNFSAHGPRFYLYNNSATAAMSEWASGALWSPRKTCLVVIARLGPIGQPYYYSLPLPSLSSNQSKDCTLFIYDVGSDDPQIPCTNTGFELVFNQASWKDGGSWVDDSTPVYKLGRITRKSGTYNKSHLAQRMYLEMSVADQKSSLRNNFSFTATLMTNSGTTIDASSWITATYDPTNLKYDLDIECRNVGILTVNGLYDGQYKMASANFTILMPRGVVDDHQLNLSGTTSQVHLTWYENNDYVMAEPLVRGNTTNQTEGAYFDSSLYDSLLGNGISTCTFVYEYATSVVSTFTELYSSGSNRYFRIKNLNSQCVNFIKSSMTESTYDKRALPTLFRYHLVTPGGFATESGTVKMKNFFGQPKRQYNSWRGSSGDDQYYRYIPSYTWEANSEYGRAVSISFFDEGVTPFNSPVFTWEWRTDCYNQTYGNGNTNPMNNAHSNSGGRLEHDANPTVFYIYNNSASGQTPSYCNAAGLSSIYASITNTVSGTSIKLPVIDIAIIKEFYFGYRFVDTSTRKMYYWYPDLSAYGISSSENPAHPNNFNNITNYSDCAISCGYMGAKVGSDANGDYYGTSVAANDARMPIPVLTNTTENLAKQWGYEAMYNVTLPLTAGPHYGSTFFYRIYPAFYCRGVLHTSSDNH